MEQKLDKTNIIPEESIIEQIEDTGLSLYDEIAQSLEDEDIDLKFDDDGNLIDNGLEDEAEETKAIEEISETEEETVKQEDDEDDTLLQTTGKGKKLSPQELKIIALKKEKQELERKLQEKNDSDANARLENERTSIKDKFIKEGWDEDSAKTMTETELRLKRIEEREAITDFKEENESVFARYPQAKTDILTIMKNSKLTGMTAEQICRGLYQETVPDADKRALDAAMGKSTRETTDTTRVSSALRSNSTPNANALTPSEQRYKRMLEIKFKDGSKMTDDEFRNIYK